jgi:hypothetical protein
MVVGQCCKSTAEKHRILFKPKLVRERALRLASKSAERSRIKRRDLKFSAGFSCCTTLLGQHGECTNSDDIKIQVDGVQVTPKKQKGAKRKRETQVLVVTPKLKGNKKSKRKQLNRVQQALRIPRGNAWSDVESQKYFLALTDPFNPRARGAKCMVFPARNTTTYTISWSATLTPLSTSYYTPYIFVPNPCLMGWVAVDTGLANPITFIDGAATNIVASSVYGMNGAIVDTTSQATPIIAGLMSNYRVVGGGIKLRGTAPTSSPQLMSSLTPLPLQNPDIPWFLASGGMSSDDTLSSTAAHYWNTNAGGGVGQQFVEESFFGAPIMGKTNLMAMPESRRFTNYEIMDKEVLGVFKVTGPDAFEFKDLTEQPQMVNNATHQVIASDLTVFESSVNNHYFRHGATDVAGWDGFYLKAQGVASYSPIQMDYILHLEGTPLTNTINTFCLPSTSSQPTFDLHKTVEQVIAVASAVPAISFQALNAINSVNKLMAYLGQTSLAAHGQLLSGRRKGEL